LFTAGLPPPRMPRLHAVHHTSLLRGSEKQTMQIGEPLRIIAVEPLDPPVNEPEEWPEPLTTEPDPEEEVATK
jgi:hypothetical protein